MEGIRFATDRGWAVGLLDLPPRLTVEEAADFLRISHLDAHRAVSDGDLAVVYVDGHLFVDTERLLEELGVRMPPLAGAQLRLVFPGSGAD